MLRYDDYKRFDHSCIVPFHILSNILHEVGKVVSEVIIMEATKLSGFRCCDSLQLLRDGFIMPGD